MKTRRLLRFPIRDELLLALLRAGTERRPERVMVPTLRGDVPPDSKIESVLYDGPTCCFVVVVSSASFAEVPAGATVPMVESDLVFEFVLAREYRRRDVDVSDQLDADIDRARALLHGKPSGGVAKGKPKYSPECGPEVFVPILPRDEASDKSLRDCIARNDHAIAKALGMPEAHRSEGTPAVGDRVRIGVDYFRVRRLFPSDTDLSVKPVAELGSLDPKPAASRLLPVGFVAVRDLRRRVSRGTETFWTYVGDREPTRPLRVLEVNERVYSGGNEFRVVRVNVHATSKTSALADVTYEARGEHGHLEFHHARLYHDGYGVVVDYRESDCPVGVAKSF